MSSAFYIPSAWQTLTLSGGLYDQVVFNVSAQEGAFVVDNLLFAPVTVPEPSTLIVFALLGIGMSPSVSGRRRRK